MEKARGVAALPCAVLVLSLVQPADGVLPMHGRACLATSSPCVVGMRLRGGASAPAVPSEAAATAAPAPPVPSEAAATAPAATFQDLLAALGGGGSAAAQQALKPSCREDTANFGVGMERSMRAMSVFNEVKADYEASLANISEPARRAQVLREVHARSAPKALKLARDNGGLYNKAAQFVASLQAGAGDRGIPKEYVDALSVLTDRAPGKPFAEMAPVLEEEFGKPVGEIFAWIEEQPLAAASLAQVHRAQLHNGTRVAVKIIYPLLRKEMASDFAVLRTFGGAIKPAGLDLTWLLADFQTALAKELDFESEAANAEQSARVLLHLPAVKIPRVFWQWTSKSVVTMELEESLLHLSDTASLSASGLDLREVGALVSDTFAEMALCHGHVHGDPHAGNIYVRVRNDAPAGAAVTGGRAGERKRPELVMLDHGQVHVLSNEARERLCKLVLACVERRGPELEGICTEIAGPALQRFLPLLLSPSFALLGYLDGWLSTADLRAAAAHQIPASVSLEDVGKCVANMHTQGGNFLGVLHSMGYTRGLLEGLGFPERLRLQSLARFAVLGLLPEPQRKRALLEGGIRHALSPLTLRRLRQAAFQVDVSRALTMAVLHALTCARVLGVMAVAFVLLYVLSAVLLRVGWVPSALQPATLSLRESPLLGFLLLRGVGLRGGQDSDH